MAIENTKNRDLFLKVSFMYFVIHLLCILGINEKVKEIVPTELIGLEKSIKPKLFNNFLDFCILTESGKLLLMEFKKNPLIQDDLIQQFNYTDRLHGIKKRVIKSIFIVTSHLTGVTKYKMSQLTFHPKIIPTKLIDKQKDLNIIRNKIKNDKMLSLRGLFSFDNTSNF